VFSLTQTGNEKFKIAIAIPTVSEERKSTGTFPMALKKIAIVSTINEKVITRLVPPILPTKGIKNALAAKHSTVREVRNESKNELNWYCSFRIGISGLIIVNPARILMAAINIGRALTIASLLLKAVCGTA
jgi:hypothetical protein